jgi:hypothetical protein
LKSRGLQETLKRLAYSFQSTIDERIIATINVGENTILIFQATESGSLRGRGLCRKEFGRKEGRRKRGAGTGGPSCKKKKEKEEKKC